MVCILHTADSDKKKDKQDKNFQGFGRFITGSTGEYYFRTIKPVPYPGRTPHIHFKIKQGRKELLVTATVCEGPPWQRERRHLEEPRRQRTLALVDFAKIQGIQDGRAEREFRHCAGEDTGGVSF